MSYNRNTCWWCGGQLVWQADHIIENAIITHLQCYDCKAFVEYTKEEEEE